MEKGKKNLFDNSTLKAFIVKVERWSYDWGFKISIEKSCYMLVTKKKIVNGQGLTLYSKPMEKVKAFKYLGLWIDEKYTWKCFRKY